MRFNFKINTIQKAVTIIIVAVSVLIFTGISVSRILRLESNLVKTKDNILETKKNELKNFIDIAFNTIEASYNKSISDEEIKLRTGDKLEQTTNVLISVISTYYKNNKNSQSETELRNNIINIVKEYKVIEKYVVEPPEEIVGIVRCQNPRCITNSNEPVKPKFKVISKDPITIRCHYCSRIMSEEEIEKNII